MSGAHGFLWCAVRDRMAREAPRYVVAPLPTAYPISSDILYTNRELLDVQTWVDTENLRLDTKGGWVAEAKTTEPNH